MACLSQVSLVSGVRDEPGACFVRGPQRFRKVLRLTSETKQVLHLVELFGGQPVVGRAIPQVSGDPWVQERERLKNGSVCWGRPRSSQLRGLLCRFGDADLVEEMPYQCPAVTEAFAVVVRVWSERSTDLVRGHRRYGDRIAHHAGQVTAVCSSPCQIADRLADGGDGQAADDLPIIEVELFAVKLDVLPLRLLSGSYSELEPVCVEVA
jgi:hypothetical protein